MRKRQANGIIIIAETTIPAGYLAGAPATTMATKMITPHTRALPASGCSSTNTIEAPGSINAPRKESGFTGG